MDGSTAIVTSPLFPDKVFVFNPQKNIFVEKTKQEFESISEKISQKSDLVENSKEVKLKKDGTPKNVKCNKRCGVKSEVYPFEIEDAKKIMDYFYKQESWQCYLIFALQCNTARRIGDLIKLQWKHFFNPTSGKFRADILEISEEKTDKLANPRINSSCRKAIELYVKKTGFRPSDNYEEFVFIQTSGNYKGKVLSADGYRKQLKRAAVELGIEYNIGTHSARKFFGKMSRMLHPGDYDSMELLQTIYNHSDVKTTKHYIGLTKEKVDKYYDDMGAFFDDYIVGGKTYEKVADTPIVSLDTNDLRNILAAAYKAGQDNAGKSETMTHIEAINGLMSMVENLSK